MTRALEQARVALDKGNLLLAYDIASSDIEGGNQSKELRHVLVLALARMGDSQRASELYREYGLDRSPDPHERAVAARILKDVALATPDDGGRRDAMQAAYHAYNEIFDVSGDAYPGINAATLAFLGGDTDTARRLAEQILTIAEVADPTNFYAAATHAEALCLLDRFSEAGAMLSYAASLPDANVGAQSSCSRQLTIVAEQAGFDAGAKNELLQVILPPTVIHYCGHMFLEDVDEEARLREQVKLFLQDQNAGFAYGSLAAGADIVIAETVLDSGGELHVTLPFDRDDFVEQSVLPAGEAWLRRFEECLDRATSVNFATEMNYVGDPHQFAYASKVAMGMAALRAQYLGSPIRQLAIWDSVPATGPAGTGADVATWKAFGGNTDIVEAGALNRNLSRSSEPDKDRHKRTLAAIIFTDFRGFSQLSEAALPAFWKGVMGEMANVLARHDGIVLAKNSWGDALHAVVSDASGAAALALDLQSALQDFDYASLGLIGSGGMRIGLHYGPVYEIDDLITGKKNFYGSEVSRAARIEPVTPPGAVFVTEPFAAILALEAPRRFRCRYVGNIEFHKDYGRYPIYRLEGR